MKILYCSGTALAGVSELMARCVNQYYPEHEARVLSNGARRHQWYIRPGVSVPCARLANRTELDAALEWADIIHCMANVTAKNMGRLDLLDKKIWVFQWHGTQIIPWHFLWFSEHYKYVKWIHIGQGWDRNPWFDQFKQLGMKIIPNIITIEDEIHIPLPWNQRKQFVAFSPSNSRRNAPNKKGIPEVTRACCDYKLVIIIGKMFEDCMRRKQEAMLGIDEVISPLYHRSGLEFLSQGTPCICSYDDFTKNCLKEATGSDVMPFINSSPETLRNTIQEYMKRPNNEKEQMGKEARAWIEKYYHPRDLLKRYFEVYKS